MPSWQLTAVSLSVGAFALLAGSFVFSRYQDSFVYYV
jgi:hypothetical protein